MIFFFILYLRSSFVFFVCAVLKLNVFRFATNNSGKKEQQQQHLRSTQPIAETTKPILIICILARVHGRAIAQFIHTRPKSKLRRFNSDNFFSAFIACIRKMYECMCMCVLYFNLAISKQEGSTSLDPHTLCVALVAIASLVPLYIFLVCFCFVFFSCAFSFACFFSLRAALFVVIIHSRFVYVPKCSSLGILAKFLYSLLNFHLFLFFMERDSRQRYRMLEKK